MKAGDLVRRSANHLLTLEELQENGMSVRFEYKYKTIVVVLWSNIGLSYEDIEDVEAL